jgi:MYXO-CTERM domain-containing protein
MVAPLLPGDYNGNGVVDAADYTVWRDNLGATGLAAYASADGDGDGEVTLQDYQLWSDNYGASITLASSQSTPEPTGMLLLLPVLGAGLLRRQRNARCL